MHTELFFWRCRASDMFHLYCRGRCVRRDLSNPDHDPRHTEDPMSRSSGEEQGSLGIVSFGGAHIGGR